MGVGWPGASVGVGVGSSVGVIASAVGVGSGCGAAGGGVGVGSGLGVAVGSSEPQAPAMSSAASMTDRTVVSLRSRIGDLLVASILCTDTLTFDRRTRETCLSCYHRTQQRNALRYSGGGLLLSCASSGSCTRASIDTSPPWPGGSNEPMLGRASL